MARPHTINTKPKYSCDVNLTDSDLDELRRGKIFEWSWTPNEDEDVIIKLKLFNGDEEE